MNLRRAALLSALLSGAALAVPAGTLISNTAHVAYHDGSSDQLLSSAPVTTNVSAVCAPTLTGLSAPTLDPGTPGVWAARLHLDANAPADVTFTLTSADLHATLLLDANDNGAPDPTDPAVPGTLTLRPGEDVTLLTLLTAPVGTPAGHVDLTAACGATQAHASINVRVRTAQVHLTKTAEQTGTRQTGDLITYHLTVDNTGQSTLTDLTVTDPLDTELDVISVSDGGLTQGRTVNWTLAPLAAGEQRTLTLVTRVRTDTPDDAQIDNTFQLDARQLPTQRSNTVSLRAFTAQLLIDKSVDRTAAMIGETVTFTVRVTNTSRTGTLRDATLTDLLPQGLTIEPGSVTLDGKSVPDPAGTPAQFPLGTFAAGQTRTVQYRTRIGPDATRALRNTASATAYGAAGLVQSTVRSNTSAAHLTVTAPGTAGQGTLTGRVFLDLDRSGTWTAGDQPAPGVRVLLAGGQSALTDLNGRYHFAGLTPGTHALRLGPGAPGEAAPHPNDGGLRGARLLPVWAATSADFPLWLPQGTVTTTQTLTTQFGPVTVTKRVTRRGADLLVTLTATGPAGSVLTLHDPLPAGAADPARPVTLTLTMNDPQSYTVTLPGDTLPLTAPTLTEIP